MLEVRQLVGEDLVDVFTRHGVINCDVGWCHRYHRSGDCKDTVFAGRRQLVKEPSLIGEDARFVTRDHVEPEQVIIEKYRRPALGMTARIECVDIFHCSVALAFHLWLTEICHFFLG